MADTVAHIVFLSNKDSEGGGETPPSTDYLLIEPTPIGFVPNPTGNTQYLNRLVIAPNGYLYAIDVGGNAVQFSGTTSNLYQNGLFKTGGVVEWGGTLTKVTAINLNGFNLNFTGAGNVTIGGTNGAEKLTVKSGNLQLDDAGASIKQKSPDGSLWINTVSDDGEAQRTSGAETRKDLSLVKADTESNLLAIPFGDRIARQWYYATDGDFFLYVRDDKSYQYVFKTYIHDQASPESIWTINHNMKAFPSVTTMNSAGDEVKGEVKYTDENTATVTFTVSIGGKAYLN